MEKAKTAEEIIKPLVYPIFDGNEGVDHIDPEDALEAMQEYGQMCAEQARSEENEKYHLERIKRIQAELKLREAAGFLKVLKEACEIIDYDLIAEINKYLLVLAAAGYGKEEK